MFVNLSMGRTMTVSCRRLVLGTLFCCSISGTAAVGNETYYTDSDSKCEPGWLLPTWKPQDVLSSGDRLARGFVYLLALLFMFIGVTIVLVRFMASIKVIISKEKETKVKGTNGETQIVFVRVWNETVANLMLMALGCSAPQILLSIIGIYVNNFQSGDLGPGTIVGSAAFNFFIIVSICISVIPNGEVRRIKHLRVFLVIVTWSLFAYLWLVIILKFITPGVVDLWEGIVTIIFFPATVVTAYIAERILKDDENFGVFNILNKNDEIVESAGIGTYNMRVGRRGGARRKVAVPYKTEEGTAKAGRDFVHAEGEIIFEENQIECNILVQILEEHCKERDVLFFVNLKEPRVIKDEEVALTISEIAKEDLTEEDICRIGNEARPKLGPNYRAQIHIKESKNNIDKVVKRANTSPLGVCSSWKKQFVEAVTVNAGIGDEEGERGENKLPTRSGCDYVIHCLTIFWKIISAFIPPADIWDGYPTFIISIFVIGVLMTFVGDLEQHLGCTVGLKDSSFVSVVLASVPVAYVSKIAAIQYEYADAFFIIVTGCNAFNIFLGVGIPWTMAAVYHEFLNQNIWWPRDVPRRFNVDPGSLAFSVTIYCSVALIAIVIILIRRHPALGGGELGGRTKFKILTSILLICLSLFYFIMSSLEAYGVVQGF